MMNKYVLPAIGIFLGVMGTATPMAQTPLGVALAVSGVMGLLTLWSSRGEIGAKIRRHAFITSLWIALTALVSTAVALGVPDNRLDTLFVYVQAVAFIALLVVVVLSVRYGLFAYRNRATEKRGIIARLVSFIGSFAAITIWIVIGLSIVWFPTLVVSKKISPMVEVMLRQMPPAGDSAIVRTDDIAKIVGEDDMTFTWMCPTPTEITVNAQPVPINTTDRLVLQRLCDANE